MSYHYLHVPTGNTGEREFLVEDGLIRIYDCVWRFTPLLAQQIIARWNRLGRGEWRFWL